jgi:hypothetical protein
VLVVLLAARRVLLVGLLLVGLLLVGQMVLLEGLRSVDLLLRIYTFWGRAFFHFVVVSTRMVCASFLLFRLCLAGLVGRVLLPEIMLRHLRLHGP